MKIISLFPLIAFALATTLPSIIFGQRFAVSNCMHKYCLILEANITGTLEYHNTVEFTVPEEGLGFARVNKDGSVCAEKEQKLQLDFVPKMQPEVSPLETQEKWSIFLQFVKILKDSDVYYRLTNYSLNVHYYPSMNSTYTNGTIPYVYSISLVNDYNGFVCSWRHLPLKYASIQFKNLKIDAFVNQGPPGIQPKSSIRTIHGLFVQFQAQFLQFNGIVIGVMLMLGLMCCYIGFSR